MDKKHVPFVLVLGLISSFNSVMPPSAMAATDNVASIAPTLPAAYAHMPRKAGGACGFDQPKMEGDSRFISGWAAISAKDGSLAESTVIGISANGTEKFAVSSKRERKDVVKHFNNPALMDSGFSAYINKADAPAGSKVTLYQVFQGNIYVCEVTATL